MINQSGALYKVDKPLGRVVEPLWCLLGRLINHLKHWVMGSYNACLENIIDKAPR